MPSKAAFGPRAAVAALLLVSCTAAGDGGTIGSSGSAAASEAEADEPPQDAQTPGSTSGGQDPSSDGSCIDPSCDPQVFASYRLCLRVACDLAYQQCLGPDYRNQTFVGPCAEHRTCTLSCDCQDPLCAEQCVESAECSSCWLNVAACEASAAWSRPACIEDASGTTGEAEAATGDSGHDSMSGETTLGDGHPR